MEFFVQMTVGDPTDNALRQRRQLADAAIAHATRGEWEAAVDANRGLLELGPDIDAYNRLGKALAELNRHAEALEAYEAALERDGTNRIAQRNVERLRVLTAAAEGTLEKPEKAPATLFIEEMGKTGHARLISIAPPRRLAQLSAGDAIALRAEGDLLIAHVGDDDIGQVEPRVALRLGKLIKSGNRYEAAITNLHDDEVRIIIREVFAHPDNFGKVSFPGNSGARSSDIRPYLKGTLRYDEDDELDEPDEDSEEVEELDTSLPEFSGEPELEEELIEET
jgi:tetratricopeptide (TPR) repeat protein